MTIEEFEIALKKLFAQVQKYHPEYGIFVLIVDPEEDRFLQFGNVCPTCVIEKLTRCSHQFQHICEEELIH